MWNKQTLIVVFQVCANTHMQARSAALSARCLIRHTTLTHDTQTIDTQTHDTGGARLKRIT
jgi:hypothetical protein